MKTYLATISIVLMSAQLHAQIILDEICDPKTEVCMAEEINPASFKDIYPFKPMPTAEVQKRVTRLTENPRFIWDIREMNQRALSSASTSKQPWGGPYWPLLQGQIANPYQERDYGIFHGGGRNPLEATSWKYNYNQYLKRRQSLYPKVYDLNEKELAKLAPSEKYDLLLGDTNFDLTNRIWSYVATWGEHKKWGYLSSINLPAGYKVPDESTNIASWEGICHGWAVAAGIADRPEKTVWVDLPNNKKMPIYPNDLKALISLLWANSTIQDAVLMEGHRCNQKAPKKDRFGRFIDTEKDRDDEYPMPKCADVHPAVYHTTIVNVLGVEGRSFVVDISAQLDVSNQPVSGYSYQYFNPETGKVGSFETSFLPVELYPKDPFKKARNAQTRYIVGVAMTLKYVDWEDPVFSISNFPVDDKISTQSFNYDLELDADFKIIGGQWRVAKTGSARLFNNQTHQPDFFWIVPRDYKKHFKELPHLPEWDFNKSSLPPKEYANAAKGAHSFIYQMTKEFGFKEKCMVLPIKKNGGEVKRVDCEFKYPRPQPLINVVNKLVEESRR